MAKNKKKNYNFDHTTDQTHQAVDNLLVVVLNQIYNEICSLSLYTLLPLYNF